MGLNSEAGVTAKEDSIATYVVLVLGIVALFLFYTVLLLVNNQSVLLPPEDESCYRRRTSSTSTWPISCRISSSARSEFVGGACLPRRRLHGGAHALSFF